MTSRNHRHKIVRLVSPVLAAILLLVTAIPVGADGPPIVSPPAVVEKMPEQNLPICLTPTPLAFGATGGGTISGNLVFQPLEDPSIFPHGQMENSRFDITWNGDFLLGVDTIPDTTCTLSLPLIALAKTVSGPVSGHMMLHLSRPLPNDPEAISIPGVGTIPVGFPVTPYSITIILDEPVQILPYLLPQPFMARMVQITKGELLFIK